MDFVSDIQEIIVDETYHYIDLHSKWVLEHVWFIIFYEVILIHILHFFYFLLQNKVTFYEGIEIILHLVLKEKDGK